MNRISHRVAVLGIGLLAPVLVIVTRLTWASTTPDRLPTHWNASGHVNGTATGATYFLWVLAGCLVLIAAVVVIVCQRRSPDAGRLLVALLVGGCWQLAAIYVLSVTLSRHAVGAESVRLTWTGVLLPIAVPLAVGVLVWFLLPASSAPVQPLPQSNLRLGPTERVTWISHAHSTGIRIAAAVVAAAGLVAAFFGAAPASVAFAVATLLAWTSEVTVRVDQDGLHTLWGPVGRPRRLIRLDEIARARAEFIQPMKWGGWGYRISSRGTAATVRTGPGIVVDRTGGSSYVVTVDGAAEGADLLNALLVRARTRG